MVRFVRVLSYSALFGRCGSYCFINGNEFSNRDANDVGLIMLDNDCAFPFQKIDSSRNANSDF